MPIRLLRAGRLRVIVGLAAVFVFVSPSFAQRKPATPPRPAVGQRTAKPATGAKPAAPSRATTPAKPASPAKAVKGSKSLDLQYITADFSLAVVVHPQPILALPLVQALPVELAQAAALEQLGVDLTKLREVIVLLSIDAAGEPRPAVIARFTEPVDQAAVELKVRQVFQRAGPEAPMAIVPEPNIVLVGRRDLLEKMFLAKGDAKSPLLERLRQLDSGVTAAALAVVEPLRDELRAALRQLPPLPPALEDFATLPDLVDFLQLAVNVGPATESTIVFECRDGAAAERLDALFDRAIKFFGETIEAQLAEMQSLGAPPMQQAPVLYARRMLRQTVASIDRQRAASRLTLVGRGEVGSAPAMAAVAAGLLLPAVQSARQAAMRSQSTNNLKMIGIACHGYHDVYGRLPTSTYDKDGKPLLSWRVHILPFVEAQALYQQFHLDEPWDSDHNKKLIAQMPAVYRNPHFVDAERTVYLAATGPQAIFPEGKVDDGDKDDAGPAPGAAGAFAGQLAGKAPALGQAVAFRKNNVDVAWARKIGFQNITDGTSNTIMVVEADPAEAVVWTRPDDLQFDPQQPMAGLGGLQKTGFNTLFCDGSVHFIASTIDPEVLRCLFNPRDGKPIPPGGF